MSRQLALGGQPVLVSGWPEALRVVEEHQHLNRLLLLEARVEEPALAPLLRSAAMRGCALVVVLGPGAERVVRAVDAVLDTVAREGQPIATSWHDPEKEPEAAVDAFGLFNSWVGGVAGISLLVTADAGLDSILDAARTLHSRTRTQ